MDGFSSDLSIDSTLDLDPIGDSPPTGSFEGGVIETEPEPTTADKVGDAIEDAADLATSVPGRFERWSEDLNDKMIDWAEAISGGKERAADRARENLTSQKISGLFSKFGRWVQDPANLGIVAAAVIGIIILIRRG